MCIARLCHNRPTNVIHQLLFGALDGEHKSFVVELQSDQTPASAGREQTRESTSQSPHGGQF